MPGTFSPLRLTAWAVLALGSIVLLSQIWRAARAIRQRVRPVSVWARYAQEASPYRRRPSRTWGVLGTILTVLVAVVLVAIGGGLLFLEVAVRAYTPFPLDETIAQVQCVPGVDEANSVPSCLLEIYSATGPYSSTIEGVRWELEGEVLVWAPALERFGFRSGYRLLRLAGYSPAGQVGAKLDLPSGGRGLGALFPWVDERFRFVQARRELISGEASAETLFEISVSRSGFSLQQWDQEQP